MAKIYVVFKTPEEENEKPVTLASGSMTTLKQRMREHVDTKWTLAIYNIKPSVPTLCQIIEDISEVEAESVAYYKVSPGGQVRETDEE